MDKSLLVRLFGFPATMIHGDTLILDRWIWLRSRLPRTRNEEHLLDIGCGTGAFTIAAARRGYHALGMSWDVRNQQVAAERAALCKAATATFEILDARELHSRRDLCEKFDIAISLETVEHILDDRKFIIDLANTLKPGGRLYLSTPHYYYSAMTESDNGPFEKEEQGWHVRRGYTPAMLDELCREAGLVMEKVSYCSGFISQKITAISRLLHPIHPLLAWALILPLRPFPPLLDPIVSRLFRWPSYSICMEAYKPRFNP